MAAPPGTGMTAFEQSLVGPVIDDVRGGIRAWNDQSVGICKGSGRECEEFVGRDAPNLLPGEYMVRAELRVPKLGEKGTWKVRFDTECTTTKKTASGESSTTNQTSKEYEVQWAGEEHGSRLSPLHRIKSPHPSGAQSCTWKVTGLHPDQPTEFTGSWSVPGPP
jgi:hypothetical protein